MDSAESRGALLLSLEPHQAVIEEALNLLVVPARPLLISRFELHAVVARVWLTVVEPACQDQRAGCPRGRPRTSGPSGPCPGCRHATRRTCGSAGRASRTGARGWSLESSSNTSAKT